MQTKNQTANLCKMYIVSGCSQILYANAAYRDLMPSVTDNHVIRGNPAEDMTVNAAVTGMLSR
jgi:hypothetical protein